MQALSTPLSFGILLFLLSACSGTSALEAGTPTRSDGGISLHTPVSGLDDPRGMDFLPDGQLLVTEKGGRLLIHEGYLYASLGDRGRRKGAQDLSTHNGSIIRLHPDGRIPDDNPFVNIPGARPEIWTGGHRNPQGMAPHPVDGSIWIREHGPQCGDELNRLRRGANYGWPVAIA